MRLDKFLKVARVIKRRSVAKNVADNEKIIINGKIKKPSTKVKAGDIVELAYYSRTIKFEIVKVPERSVSKEESSELISVIE